VTSEPVASIQIYFEGRAKFFPHRKGTNRPKREAGRVESGGGVFGRRQRAASPLLAIGVYGEHCKLPQLGPGQSPGKKMKFGATLRPQNLLQKCL